jgi:VWFA-related protein
MTNWFPRYVCSGLALVTASVAQAPAVTPGPTARLVRVSVVVHDKQGRPVTDLKTGEFTLKDQGKRQVIRILSRPGENTGVTAILLDRRHLTMPTSWPSSASYKTTCWPNEANPRHGVVKYLLQIQPHDHVALYVLGRELRLVHDFDEEPAALLKALSAYLAQGTPDLASDAVKLELVKAAATVAANAEQARAAARAVEQIMTILDDPGMSSTRDSREVSSNALETIAHHLAGVRGPKDLVLVSDSGARALLTRSDWGRLNEAMLVPPGDSLPSIAERDPSPPWKYEKDDKPNPVVRALNSADVTVYPVRTGCQPDAYIPSEFRSLDLGKVKYIARRMGGKAYEKPQDLMKSLPEAVKDLQAAYILTYYPTEQKLNSRFRLIEVKVTRPGTSVRHRAGYYDVPDDK